MYHFIARRLRSRSIALLVLLSALLSMPTAAHAQGILGFPDRIEITDALRGAEYQRTVTFRNNFEQDGQFELSVIDGDAAPWITLLDETGQSVSVVPVEAGQSARITVDIDVPAETPNGTYRASIGALFTGPEDQEGVGIRLGLVVPVTIEVTGEQTVDGAFVELIANDGEVGLPHRLSMTIRNGSNVGVRPLAEIEITRDGDVVFETTTELEFVPPGETRTIPFDWDTSEQRPGTHVARVRVKILDLDLGEQQRAFDLAPRGTLSRSGEIVRLALIGDPPEPGAAARIAADFANTGQVESRGILVADVFRDEALVDRVETAPVLVQPGDVATIEAFVDTPVAGTYTIVAKINFEGEETEAATLSFEVAEPPPPPGNGFPWLPIGIGLGVVLVGGLGAFFVARRRRRIEETPARPVGDHDAVERLQKL